MPTPAYHTDHHQLHETILGFVHYARSYDLNVGLLEAQEALKVAAIGLMGEKEQFKYALKSIFTCSEEDGILFEKIFHEYWKDRGTFVKSKVSIKGVIKNQYESPGTLVFMGQGKDDDKEMEEAKNTSGANRTARLRKTDFTKVADIDKDYLEQIALKLWKQMSLRLKKRLKNDTKGQINLRSTIRSNMSRGGNFIDLKRKGKKLHKFRLVILLDVSGSMDKYSFFLLRFLWALRSQFESIEAFVFSTELVRITDQLKDKDLRIALQQLSTKVHHWSSGTQIGESLRIFNEVHAKRVLNGRSMTIMLSDGLDTGEPELLAQQLSIIKRRTRKLIWLNPLKGMQGYEPTARGMSAALPEVDIFKSAHSLDSLLELENFLANV